MHSSHEKKEILAVSYDAVTGTLKLTLAGLNEPVEGTLKEVSAVVAADFAIGKNMKSAAIVTHLKAFIESLNLQQRAAAELIGLKDKARVSDVLKRKAGVPTNKAVLQLAIAKELLRRASAVDSALYTYSGSTQAALAATGSSSATSSSSTPKSAHDVTRSSFWSAALKASYRVHVKNNSTPMTSEQLCSSAVALFWVALERHDESRRNNSEKRIFAAGRGALMQDTELPGVCLRWMRQANSQAAAIRELSVSTE